MSTKIEQNTTDLQAILDAVNALPEAGSGGSSGGGSIETCDCEFACDAPSMDDATVYYVNGNMEVSTKSFAVMDGTRITVAKNTIVTVVPWTSMCSTSGNCSKLMSSAIGGSFIINGDTTITYA